MNILIGFLITVEVIVSLLLILIVLVQPSKSGGGLGGAAFGGGMGEQLFGARAGNVLTKGTVLFAVIFLVNTLALAFIYARYTGTPAAPVATRTAPPPGGLQGLPELPPELLDALGDAPAAVSVEDEEAPEAPEISEDAVDVGDADETVEADETETDPERAE